MRPHAGDRLMGVIDKLSCALVRLSDDMEDLDDDVVDSVDEQAQ